MEEVYTLPKLSYGYKSLEPHMSEAQLTIHHQKHHQAYVNGANALLQKMGKARGENADLDMKATLKELSFNVGGHVLHSLFWESVSPKGGGKPGGVLGGALEKEYGSFERFRKEFTQAATSVEGSGWAALAYSEQLGKPVIMQVEKHNANVYPAHKLILALDVFEHAYYLDYKNDRAKFVDEFWSIVDWDKTDKRLGKLL